MRNGHDHFFTNPNGDFRKNAIVEGTAQVIDLVTGDVLATGHGSALFGIEANNNNFVTHDTVNAQAGGVKIHMQGQFTLNGNGTITVNRQAVTCG